MSWPIPEIPEPALPPRPGMWAWAILGLFIMSMLCGLILHFWPQEEPVQTPWFWFCVAFVPFAGGVVPLALRFHYWESEAALVEHWLAQRRHTLQAWHAWARQSLLLVDGAILLPLAPELASAPAGPDAGKGAAAPETFFHPDEILRLDTIAPQGVERRDALAWARLLAQMKPALNEALSRVPAPQLEVILDGCLVTWRVADLWQETWRAAGLPGTPRVRVLEAPLDPLWIENWIEQGAAHFRLLVSTRLFQTPEPPETEMALMLLIAPGSAYKAGGFTGKAWLRRPAATQDERMRRDVAAIFTVEQTSAASVGSLWLNHAPPDMSAALKQALWEHGGATAITPEATRNLDTLLGRFGDAGQQAAIAMALHPSTAKRPSLIMSHHPDGALLNVLVPAGEG